MIPRIPHRHVNHTDALDCHTVFKDVSIPEAGRRQEQRRAARGIVRLMTLEVTTTHVGWRRVDPEGYPRVPLRRELWSRVTSEGTREITTRRGRSFPVLVTSPRDGTTGPTVS